MENKFKVGDKVRRTENSYGGMRTGDIGTVIKSNAFGVYLKEYGDGGHHECSLELVKKGKSVKVKPVDKHLVLIDSCQNFVGISNSYKEATELAKSQSEDVTVYKIVEVANVKSIRSIKKIQKVKKKVKK